MSGLSFGRFEGLFEYALLKDGNNKVPTSISVGDVEFIESFITE